MRRLPKLHEITISNRVMGFGGERNAYDARFVHATGFTGPDEQWVVKESRYEKSLEEEEAFHRKSLITQKWAELLAAEFNRQVRAHRHALKTRTQAQARRHPSGRNPRPKRAHPSGAVFLPRTSTRSLPPLPCRRMSWVWWVSPRSRT